MRRRLWFGMALLAVVVVASVVAAPRSLDTAGPRLLWSDEFAGAAGRAPNPAVWAFKPGGTGWGHQELQCYTGARRNSALDGHGDLVITARRDPGYACAGGTRNDYTSARLLAYGMHVKYGHIVVRAQLPRAPGMWSAIWSVGADQTQVGWPESGEMDLAELVGSQPRVVHGSLHGPGPNGAYNISGVATEPANSLAAFHLYGLAWTSQRIDFSVDGRVYKSVSRSAVVSRGGWVFDKPFQLLLSLAVGGTWPGPPTASTTWPQRMVVDYVRVYT